MEYGLQTIEGSLYYLGMQMMEVWKQGWQQEINGITLIHQVQL